jgi:hypothetical protein
MEYSKLVAVTGLPGLYELISSKNDGAVIRSLDDNSTKFAASRVHNFSHLESIEVYTTGDNVNLAEIFFAMEKASGAVPDTRDNGAVKKYFEKVYPELDFERVYSSDLKKMVKWFEGLKKHNIEIKLPEPVQEEESEEVVVKDEPKEKPKKKEKAEKPAAKEKEEAPKKKETKTKAEEKKPAKKTAKKKEEPPKKKAAKKKK